MIKVKGRRPHEVAADALQALAVANNPPQLFQHGGKLVHIRTDEHGRVSIEAITNQTLRYYLSRAADFEAPLSRETIRVILGSPDLKMPTLRGWVIRYPVILADGRVLDAAGYDVETRLYLQPEPGHAPRPLAEVLARFV